jgi:SAM-dependent methyltransferase
MKLDDVRQTWDGLAATDPLWAVLAEPDKSGNRWRTDEFFETGRAEMQAVMDHVSGLGVEPGRQTAFDFGCGVGRLTQALAEHFEVVIAMDISAVMLARAREHNRHGNRCQYLLNERDDLAQLADASIDFIYSSRSLQHTPPRYIRTYLKEFLRVLKPSGILVFQLPSHYSTRGIGARLRGKIREFIPTALLTLYRRLRHGRLPPFDVFGIPQSQVTSILKDQGAQVIHVEQFDAGLDDWVSLRYYVTQPGR